MELLMNVCALKASSRTFGRVLVMWEIPDRRGPAVPDDRKMKTGLRFSFHVSDKPARRVVKR